MAALGHIGVGLAAKRVAPEVPIGAMLLAVEASDILWGVFALTGIDKPSGAFPNPGPAPWSHGLFMSVVWSVLAGLLAARIYRRNRTGVVIGGLVFSHWVLDFITHPMWPNRVPDLPLLFKGSPMVGLGLYSSTAVSLVIDFGLVLLGAAIYVHGNAANRRLSRQSTNS